MIRSAFATLFVLSLAGCGGEAPDATATAAAAGSGAMTEAECTLLTERARDQAISAAPADQQAQMREFFTSGMATTIADCTEGGIYDREAYDCVSKVPAGSAESHACIVAANQR